MWGIFELRRGFGNGERGGCWWVFFKKKVEMGYVNKRGSCFGMEGMNGIKKVVVIMDCRFVNYYRVGIVEFLYIILGY